MLAFDRAMVLILSDGTITAADPRQTLVQELSQLRAYRLVDAVNRGLTASVLKAAPAAAVHRFLLLIKAAHGSGKLAERQQSLY